jgi:hypothetical protein
MSLTTIRTFGWLTGTAKNIRDIGTYGWFAVGGAPPVFPVGISSVFQVPAEYLAHILSSITVPVETNSEVVLITSEKSTPIESLSEIILTNNISSDFIGQFEKTRKIIIENTQGLARTRKIPAGNLLYLSDTERSLIEYGGITEYFSSTKLVPIEYLTNVVIYPSFPVEGLDYPLMWYLDERGVLWHLDERTTQWIIANRDNTWTVPERFIQWIIEDCGLSWILEERQ